MTPSASAMITNSVTRRLRRATAVNRLRGRRARAGRPAAGACGAGALRVGASLGTAGVGEPAPCVPAPCVGSARRGAGAFAPVAGPSRPRGRRLADRLPSRARLAAFARRPGPAAFVPTRFAAGACPPPACRAVRAPAPVAPWSPERASRSGGGGSGCGSRPSGRVPAPTRPRRGRPLRPGTASRITAARQGASSPSPNPGRGSAPSHPYRRSRNLRPSGPAR